MNKRIVSALCLAFILVSCGGENKRHEEARTVKTIITKDYTTERTTPFPGKVVAAEEAKLAFRIAGPIAKIHAHPGKAVRKGELLASLEARDYEIQLAATEAEYKRIKAEADRIIELHKQKSVSDNDYDKAIYGLQQITAKLNAHRNALADTRLVAPFDGYIQEPLFKAGETVGAGMPVLVITGAGTPEVEINIPASEYLEREHFGSFTCTVNVFPDRVFPLELISIDPMANLNQLYRMRLRFKRDSNGELPTIGMSAMVNIGYSHEGNRGEIIPATALWEKDGKTYVWIVEGKDNYSVHAQEVVVVEMLREGHSVCHGIGRDKQIVVAGVHALKEGDKVRLLEEKTATNVGGLL
ncbi:efflux RND transporter periplasmic adaptor subunit [Porphyromonas loveana]|uniref:efflux RND transporter periplasmic adaptor subunit n=1 Tax=Porphyromonas loveana TaxID=1884669 RepID=UPI0035A04147